nr:MAG TPA: hypothetical protein [Caudoviricetes sp.]DAK18031.1 MAG TPA: hypothetical protein [Caudoviricetes sp.]
MDNGRAIPRGIALIQKFGNFFHIRGVIDIL